MIKPEQAVLNITVRPTFRPAAVRVRWSNLAITVLVVLAIGGVAAYVYRLLEWGDRPKWAYPAVVLMFTLSTAAGAPLLAYASRAARGYWALPIRRIAEVFIIPALLSFALLIPILASLPPLAGRANLWFGFRAGAPFLTDALAVGMMLAAGLGILWVSAVPDLAGSPPAAGRRPAWKRLLLFSWAGGARQWLTVRVATRVFGAFYLALYVYAHLVLSTDLGQSLLPGWRSGIFPAYHALTGIQGGLAITVVTLWLMRRFTKLGIYIGNDQANNIAKPLLATVLLWFYFFWSEFLIVWYARLPGEVMAMQVQVALVYRPVFLLAFCGLFLIPFICLIFNPVRRNLSRLALVAVVVLIGLLFDRIRLFVPSMSNPDELVFAHRLEALPAPVFPDAVDVLFVVGWLAIIALVYIWAASRIPMLVGWELRQASMLRREEPYLKGHVMLLGKPD